MTRAITMKNTVKPAAQTMKNTFHRMLPIIMAVLLFGQVSSYATADTVKQAAGNTPKEKTTQLIANEKELTQLIEKENGLKKDISNTTINRSKLLAQKRADLKEVRKKRDDALNKEKAEIKTKRDKQAQFVKDLKSQRANLKKLKSDTALAVIDISIAAAEIKLNEYKTQYDSVVKKLSKSYEDYKEIYDKLTKIDLELKKLLDKAEPNEKKIKDLKLDLKKYNDEYSKSIKAKDFLAAQRIMNSRLSTHKAINSNYTDILEYKKRFKNDYYAQIVNYKI